MITRSPMGIAIANNCNNYTLLEKSAYMVLENGRGFNVAPFAIGNRLRIPKTILSCEEL